MRVLPVIAADAVPNAVRHPDLLWQVGASPGRRT